MKQPDSFKCETWVEYPEGKDTKIEATVNCGYDGIGPYEFWGQKCYDKGQPCFEVILEKATGENGEEYPTDLFDTEQVREALIESACEQSYDWGLE